MDFKKIKNIIHLSRKVRAGIYSQQKPKTSVSFNLSEITRITLVLQQKYMLSKCVNTQISGDLSDLLSPHHSFLWLFSNYQLIISVTGRTALFTVFILTSCVVIIKLNSIKQQTEKNSDELVNVKENLAAKDSGISCNQQLDTNIAPN